MSTLGIGVRVYVGWSRYTNQPDVLCQTGTIIDGPFAPGLEIQLEDCIAVLRSTTWLVRPDDSALQDCAVCENLLTPIDRDPDALTVDEQEEETA